MINEHLYILHLFPNTEDETVNKVAQIRHDNLLAELQKQGITQFTLIPGEYNPSNAKQAIHKGHHKIIQLAKDLGLNNVVVCEDDIKFSHPNSFNYFLSQIPQSYDIFCGLVYSAEVRENRILNGGSGMMTLFVVNQRHYDFFLSMDINNHVDREAGLTAFKHEYYVCDPYVCEQRGGYSIQRRAVLYYDAYLTDKKLYGVD